MKKLQAVQIHQAMKLAELLKQAKKETNKLLAKLIEAQGRITEFVNQTI